MACSLKSFCSSNHAFCRKNLISQYPKIRFQSFKENGKNGANIVDANLSVLKERMKQVRKRESLILHNTIGWNYKHNYDPKHKRDNNSMESEFAEIIVLSCGAIGFVFLIGSICICLVSFLVYISI